MAPKTTLTIGLILLILLVAISSLYTVRQGQSALVTRFGKIITEKKDVPEINQPGLHMKLPLVDSVLKFDMRLQTLDIKSSRFKTTKFEDGIVDLIVDYYVKWRISNLPLYYTRTGGQINRTQTLLRQQLNEVLKAEFGRRTVQQVVSDNRDVIMQTMNEKAKVAAKNLGVDVVDVRIKRIDLPDEVSANVYERMKVDRERAAREMRAEGKAMAEELQANADANVTILLAKAREEASKVRAQGDATASKIYSNAYSQDPEFYSFYRSLLAYTNTFDNKQNMLILTPSSQFFDYFNHATTSVQQRR